MKQQQEKKKNKRKTKDVGVRIIFSNTMNVNNSDNTDSTEIFSNKSDVSMIELRCHNHRNSSSEKPHGDVDMNVRTNETIASNISKIGDISSNRCAITSFKTVVIIVQVIKVYVSAV